MEFDVNLASATKLKKWIGFDDISKLPALGAYLVNFDGGRAATPESDFLSNRGYDSERVRLLAQRVIINNHPQLPRLMDYETTRLSKYGPQGWIYPMGSNDMIDKIRAYYTHAHYPCKYDPKALKEFKTFAQGAQLEPYTYEQVVARGLEKNGLKTNAGLPLFTKRDKVIPQVIEMAYRNDIDYPAVIGARSIKNKMRLIFMAPFSQNLKELSFVYPIMDYLLQHVGVTAAWRGQPQVQDQMNTDFFGSNRTYMSTDFSAMDTTVGLDQIRVAADLMASFFKDEWKTECKQIVTRSSYQDVVAGVLRKPGIANKQSPGKTLMYISGEHGLFSGLGFTNLAETLLQMLLDIEIGYHLPILATQINGDDGVKAIDGHKNLDRCASIFSKLAGRYGFVANVEKQLVSYDEVHYLQRVYSPETTWSGVVHGAYPIVQTLNSAKNPERSRYLTPEEQALRLLMIFENLADSPLLGEGAKILVAGSPYIQKWVESGMDSTSLAEKYVEVAGSSEDGSNLSGKTGLADLGIVKYLKHEGSAGVREALKDYGAVI
jgi:hypothetical protein